MTLQDHPPNPFTTATNPLIPPSTYPFLTPFTFPILFLPSYANSNNNKNPKMNSYKKLEDKLMDLRLPLPQQRLAIARGVQRVATAVGHHHFAQLTEVACGRIEAEMVPREERGRKRVSKAREDDREKGGRKDRRRVRRNRGSEDVSDVDGDGEGEEHFASGALGPKDRDGDGEQGDDGFVFGPEERARMAKGRPRENPRAGAQPHQHPLHDDREILDQFGQPWRGESPPGQENHPTQRPSSRHRKSPRPSHEPGKSHQRHRNHRNHPRSKRQIHQAPGAHRSHHHRSSNPEHRPRRRKHTHKSPTPAPPKKENLTWKVLLRGFIKGVAAFEMNELQKRQAAIQTQSQVSRSAQRQSRPRRRRSGPIDRTSRTPSPGPSRPRQRVSSSNTGRQSRTSRQTRSSSRSPMPSRGRSGLRHASSDDLPLLTPEQIHWREVRAREQGQADVLRAEEEAAAHQRDQQQHGDQQQKQPGDVEALAHGEHPFVNSTLPPDHASRPRVPDMPGTVNALAAHEPEAAALPSTVVGGTWSFPANLAATWKSLGESGPNKTPSLRAQALRSPLGWGDPIKEMENRQNKQN
ncbi:hypothetical protein FKW77_007960 [Venturia effusa]|uniref:Uncharacterized protein n=1 Tax=Venturia effusa TaxID=50376 RepID=A0A517LE70_9PEZI|nr:hypothetical protein FKW77_007960 [Venturia effusa]